MYTIPPKTYLFIYYHFLLIVVLVSVFRLVTGRYKESAKGVEGYVFAALILLFIGLRPYDVPGVGKYFGDTINYYHSFMREASWYQNQDYKDIGFGLFTKFCAENLNARAYFFILASFYVVPAYCACKRLSSNYTFLLFLMFTASFLFWANGVNGIRSGVASSFLLLGFICKDKKWLQVFLFALAVLFHKSMILPLLAYVLAYFYKNSKGYIAAWFASIVLSLSFGGFWENFFAGFNVGDERFSTYLTSKEYDYLFAYTGFRWDFLIFSAVPVVLGAYFIFKKHYSDKFYIQLYNTYLLANSFWILVVRSSFSNRFASLSWFLIPLILLLPLIKKRIWKMQMAKISLLLLVNFAFTYLMTYKILWQ